MTAVRCTMSDTMYIGRTTGQLVRIALRSLRNARSAPISPTAAFTFAPSFGANQASSSIKQIGETLMT